MFRAVCTVDDMRTSVAFFGVVLLISITKGERWRYPKLDVDLLGLLWYHEPPSTRIHASKEARKQTSEL